MLSSLFLADDHQSKNSFDASETAPTSQYSAISSNLSIATSIQERRGEDTPLNRVWSNEERPSGDGAEGDSCAREGSTVKGNSNASSLATVLEEPVEGRNMRQPAGSNTVQINATEAVSTMVTGANSGSV